METKNSGLPILTNVPVSTMVRTIGRPHVKKPSMESASSVTQPVSMEAEYLLIKKKAQEAGFAEGIEQGRKEGFKQGFSSGTATAEKAADEKMANLFKEKSRDIEKLLSTMSNAIDRSMQSLEQSSSDIAFEALIKIIGHADHYQDIARRAVEQVLSQIRTGTQVKVRLHSSDMQLIQAFSAFPPDIAFVADDSLSIGGCLVESPFGVVNASLETQLKALRTILDSTRSAIYLKPQ